MSGECAIKLFLLVSLLIVCQGAEDNAVDDSQPGEDEEAKFQKFLKDNCFNATKGVAMAGLTKYLMTAAKSAYECLNLCISYGLDARPPVCCHAVNYFANRHANPEIPDERMYLKPGACECYYSESYVAQSKKKLAVWLKREASNKCLSEDPSCPAMPTMPPAPSLFAKRTSPKDKNQETPTP